ncbi:hypothetical protein [Streptomyces sp. NPDC003006]
MDLDRAAFRKISGQDAGLADATWDPADPSFGKGIIKSGHYDLPGLRKWVCDSSGCR